MVSEVNALEMRQQRAFDVEDLLSRMCPWALMISQPQIGIFRFVVFCGNWKPRISRSHKKFSFPRPLANGCCQYVLYSSSGYQVEFGSCVLVNSKNVSSLIVYLKSHKSSEEKCFLGQLHVIPNSIGPQLVSRGAPLSQNHTLRSEQMYQTRRPQAPFVSQPLESNIHSVPLAQGLLPTEQKQDQAI